MIFDMKKKGESTVKTTNKKFIFASFLFVAIWAAVATSALAKDL